ncbi:TonB-dependent receptor [Methylopila jiangsuensis]|uniref:TonB-dependent receptor n=1 Tax=Methylopila jiangsuensis TaxID=586230 RepID=A0A9W6JLG7_9HYPH|nr:TonB-dependent receptor [Methylopila jiangsuensis]MDR6284726.1 iron complex outermembrane receptor protein [Methylopila jiangsuensis]GLK77884.1 TonB-dependent receptor [Methylopila jiangsuensis]
MLRTLLLAGVASVCAPAFAHAQSAEPEIPLPELNVEGAGARALSLTSPGLDATRRELERTPGAVEVIDAETYKRTSPALTVKDALDYTPGVFAQPKWGDDTRLSIRGSGLSRNFHLRGVQLYLDGVPINTADGYGDFQEIDPSAYRLVEVYKGANALRFGANALGGAINFVTATGRDPIASVAQGGIDVGSFGHVRTQASSGGVHGNADYFITGSWQRADGFRDHSDGDAARVSANIGYRLSEDVETRFYLNANTVDQNIPGAVTREQALKNPKRANSGNVAQDYERNIDTLRFANKTTFRLSDATSVEAGAFVVSRHLEHPIYQWLDYKYFDYGGFARVTDEREIAGHANRLVAGLNLHNGENDARNYVNVGGSKGGKRSDAEQTSRNVSAYAENTFFAAPTVGLVTGIQFLYAKRSQKDRFFDDALYNPSDTRADDSGSKSFSEFSPKIGLLWNIDPTWQAFANVSRSVEAPSYGENSFASAALAKPQKAWTYEIGTRGAREDFTWDVALYRMEIKDELQCQDGTNLGSCTVVNLDKTVHQGVELGFGAAVWKGLFVKGVDASLVAKGDAGAPAEVDKLWLNVAYTFNDFYFDGDQKVSAGGPSTPKTSIKGNDLPGAPRHYVRAELLYKHPSGVYAGPNVEWVPEAYYVDNANTQKTKAYALLGAKVGYDAGGALSAYVEGRNLTNEKYISSASITERAALNSPLYEPGTGRAVYAGVKYRW